MLENYKKFEECEFKLKSSVESNQKSIKERINIIKKENHDLRGFFSLINNLPLG